MLVSLPAPSATQVTVRFDKLSQNTKRLKRNLGNIAALKGGYGLDLPTIAVWVTRLGIQTIALDDMAQAIRVQRDLRTSPEGLRKFNAFVKALKKQGIEPEMIHMAKTRGIPLLSHEADGFSAADSEDYTHARVGKGFWVGFSDLGTSDAVGYAIS